VLLNGPVFLEPVTQPGQQRISKERIIRVRDGWLYIVSSGEGGGFVWWISSDGTKNYKVSSDQVSQYFQTAAGLLATEGSAHGFSRGKVIRLKLSASGRWISEKFAPLNAAPAAAHLARDGSLLVATDADLVCVRTNGTVETLIPASRACWQENWPHSMVVRPSGDIYMGLSFAVARLRKRGRSYEQSWLIPDTAYWKTLPTEP
jgi:hypothetical protein